MKVEKLIEFNGVLEVKFYDTYCDHVFMQYAEEFMQYSEEFTDSLFINFDITSRIEANSQYYREVPQDEH